MLKITHDINAPEGGAVLRLEGQIAGPWVGELRRVYAERRQHTAAPLTFDLRDVTFIDAAGIAFLDDVYADVILTNCSLFAAEQLKAVTERHHEVRR